MVKNDPGHQSTSRRERKRTEVRTRLYEAALQLFRERGYASTTVAHISEAADVAKGTFFNHFPTKEHVLAAYQNDMMGQILAMLSARRFRGAEAAVREAMRECARWVERDLDMARVVMTVLFGSGVMLDVDEANEARFVAWFREQIDGGVSRGELREETPIDLVVELLLNALSSTVHDWVFREQPFDLERHLLAKADFLLAAARSPDRRR